MVVAAALASQAAIMFPISANATTILNWVTVAEGGFSDFSCHGNMGLVADDNVKSPMKKNLSRTMFACFSSLRKVTGAALLVALIFAGGAHADPNSGDGILLVGGATLNGDFNAAPGESVTFANTPVWYNTRGQQTQVATRNNNTFDGTQNGILHTGRGFGVDTGHVIAEGNAFNFSYVWKDDWQWVGSSGEVKVSLFVTDDNTLTGNRTDLVVDFSGIRQVAGAYESVSREFVYFATAADAGKTLFAAIETDSSGFARLDNFELIVIPDGASFNVAPVFTADPFIADHANEGIAYSNTIAGSATDANGDVLTYAKVSGPAWLAVASDGTLSGTPGNGDLGANSFTVSASDGKASPVEATLNITVFNLNIPPADAPPNPTFGLGTIQLPTSVSGGSGIIYQLQGIDDNRYSVGKGDTATIGGFQEYVGTIDSVYLFVKYSVESGYEGSNSLQVNGVDTGIIPAERDYGRIGYVEITGGGFGINTTAEIESMTVSFTNNDTGDGANVFFDYVFVVVNPQTAIPQPPTWSEEFNGVGAANPMVWNYEQGYRRNNELQYYMVGASNGWMEDGKFIIEARQEPSPSDPQKGVMDYTSASIQTANKYYWRYGRAQIRAKIPAVPGMWPAIWGVGKEGQWPHNGEVDIMEYYQEKILANCAVGNASAWSAKWNSATRSMSTLVAVDPNWKNEYHIWTMQWDEDYVRLYVDNILMNAIPQSWLRNHPDYNPLWGPEYPFTQPFTCWLNLALGGGAGGSVAGVSFPQRYYIDYWKIWEDATDNAAPTDITLDSLNIPEQVPAGTVVGYLTATDPDPAEVHRYQLVSGTGDTHNAQFEIPEFLSDNTLQGVVKTTQPLAYADGATRSIRVRVTDIEGATYEKVFTLNVEPEPAIEVRPDSAFVPEGGTQTFEVRLRSLPTTDITVNVTRDSGDEDITVISGSTLTFTPDNGTDWQTVTLAAAEDDDFLNGMATILCSDPSGTYASVFFAAVEADNDYSIDFSPATGGTITEVGGYYIHTFSEVGADTFQIVENHTLQVEVLVVGGGGGGGSSRGFSTAGGGGGGAGGLITQTGIFAHGAVDIFVGDAGNAGLANNTPGTNGEDSRFGNLVALGGGGGSGGNMQGRAGGSGGGSRGNAGGEAMQPDSTSGGFGNNGGAWTMSNGHAASGGGGAGGAAPSSPPSGPLAGGGGGIGLAYDISGSTVHYAGGGGGGGSTSSPFGSGGLGGGGNGGNDGTAPTPGTPNTGGGGGGGNNSQSGADGGSGIVIVRYPVPATLESIYIDWAAANGLSGSDQEPTAILRPDGLTNLQKFAYGLDPNLSAFNPLEFTMDGELTVPGIPTLHNFASPGAPDAFRAVFIRRKDHEAANLTYTVHFSADLKQWTPSDMPQTVLTDENNTSVHEVVSIPFPDNVPVVGADSPRPAQFMRVTVAME